MIQDAIKKYKQEGLFSLLIGGWDFLYFRTENRCSGLAFRFLVQLYWLPFLKLVLKSDVGYKLVDIRGNYTFHSPQLSHHKRAKKSSLARKYDIYYNHDTVRIKNGDIIVDVGAFIGEASIAVADEASSIYAIEPSPRSYPCLEANAAQFDHITTANYAVWDKRDEIEFNLGSDPTEDSILDPDDTDETNSITVPADTIEQICNDLNVDTVDFLKIEAEGVEPEILDGIGQLQPTKIAVNCDPERDGQSPKLSVIEKLSNKGYSVFEGGGPSYTVVYGTLAQECK